MLIIALRHRVGRPPDRIGGSQGSRLLIIGFVAKIAIVWTIGIVVLVLGLIAILLGSIGHGVGGRRHYW